MTHSKEEAEDILRPYLVSLGSIFPRAWQSWDQLGEAAPGLRLQLGKRSRASMIHDFATAVAYEVFDGCGPAVVLDDKPGFLLMTFDSKLYVRLKKYKDGSLQTCGIPTIQRSLFFDQEPIQPTLTGWEDTTNLVLGYRPNAESTAVGSTMISCATRKRAHWTIELEMAELKGKVIKHPAAATPRDAEEPEIVSTLTEKASDVDVDGGGIGG